MSTLLDYRDRTVDALAFQGMSTFILQVLEQALATADNPGKIVTGIQKLVQRWLLEFFTEEGSLLYLPLRGCRFMTMVRQGRLRTTLDVQQEFRLAQVSIRRNLAAEETADDPEDERFDDATLEQVAVTPDMISIRVRLLSLAGTNYTFITPLGVTPHGG